MLKPTIIDIRGIGLQMTNLADNTDKGELNTIVRHLRVIPTLSQTSGISKPLKTRKNKIKLGDGQRYVKGRAIAKLPEVRYAKTSLN